MNRWWICCGEVILSPCHFPNIIIVCFCECRYLTQRWCSQQVCVIKLFKQWVTLWCEVWARLCLCLVPLPLSAAAAADESEFTIYVLLNIILNVILWSDSAGDNFHFGQEELWVWLNRQQVFLNQWNLVLRFTKNDSNFNNKELGQHAAERIWKNIRYFA